VHQIIEKRESAKVISILRKDLSAMRDLVGVLACIELIMLD
jgi:hypothetical protein